MSERYVSLGNQQLYCRFYVEPFNPGQPTIVLLHEALGSVAQWRDFPMRVAEKTGLHVMAFDRLGHGQSSGAIKKRGLDYLHIEAWEVLPVLFQQLEIPYPILYGHSDGGTIALLYAVRFPTQALITEGAHVFVEEITLQGVRDASMRKDFLIEKLTRFHAEKTGNLFIAWADTWLDPVFKNWNIEGLLPDISCPALILQGENDEYGTRAQVDRIVAGIGKKTQGLLIPECGHAPHKEIQDSVIKEIHAFLHQLQSEQ
jgi:pimeloyl-ACP methyl ester carboxylesterase